MQYLPKYLFCFILKLKHIVKRTTNYKLDLFILTKAFVD